MKSYVSSLFFCPGGYRSLTPQRVIVSGGEEQADNLQCEGHRGFLHSSVSYEKSINRERRGNGEEVGE